ncbi:MAG: glycosyltransferase family 39 protein, partial [Thermoguttaceae bacterium]
DEGLLASIAQEMVERGNWLTPQFLGKPFFDKPILYFWCQALSIRLFGAEECAVRLPGLIFGLFGAVTTGLIGRRMFGEIAGYLAGIFYATMIVPVALTQVPVPDVALIPVVNLAMLLLWQSDQSSAKCLDIKYTLVIGFFVGLSILTKGLVGVALIVLSFGCYTLILGRPKTKFYFQTAAVILFAALTASFWFVALEIKYPGYLYYYFIERHLLGFATSTQRHGTAPWWYYVPIILGGGLPWIGYLPVTIRDAFLRRRENKSAENKSAPSGAMTWLWCWVIGGFLMFSAAHSKMITYIWPLFPPLAVLAAVGWVKLFDGTLDENLRRSLLRTFFLSSLTGPFVLPLVVFAVSKIYGIAFSWPAWTAVILAGSAALIPLIFFYRRQWRAMLSASALSIAVQFIVLMLTILPPVAENFTARQLADYFNRRGQLPAKLIVAEERIGSLVFYLDPALRREIKQDQLVAISKDRTAEITRGAIIALPERRVNKAEKYLDLQGLTYTTVGRYRLYEIRD